MIICDYALEKYITRCSHHPLFNYNKFQTLAWKCAQTEAEYSCQPDARWPFKFKLPRCRGNKEALHRS